MRKRHTQFNWELVPSSSLFEHWKNHRRKRMQFDYILFCSRPYNLCLLQLFCSFRFHGWFHGKGKQRKPLDHSFSRNSFSLRREGQVELIFVQQKKQREQLLFINNVTPTRTDSPFLRHPIQKLREDRWTARQIVSENTQADTNQTNTGKRKQIGKGRNSGEINLA